MPLDGAPLLLLGDALLVVPGAVVLVPGAVLVPGVLLLVVFGVLLLVPGGVVLVPEAANATAGATEMITGTLQPALSSVRLETRNDRSGRLLPSAKPS